MKNAQAAARMGRRPADDYRTDGGGNPSERGHREACRCRDDIARSL